MHFSKPYLLSILGLILLGGIGLYYVVVHREDVSSHLIQGVPYYGTYTAEPVETSAQAAASVLFRYWDKFFPLKRGDVAALFPKTRNATLHDFVDAFNQYGYVTTVSSFKDVKDVLPYLQKEIPVVVELKMDPERLDGPTGFFVIIGYDVERDVYIVHENTYGNNYTIPRTEFSQWFAQDLHKRFLAVSPRGSLTDFLPDFEGADPYPVRLGLMNSEGMQDLGINLEEIHYWENYYAEYDSTRLWESRIAHPAFAELIHRGRVLSMTSLGLEYVLRGTPDQAIALMYERAIPINQNLTEPFGEWPEFPDRFDLEGGVDVFPHPWIILGAAYLQKGDVDSAETAFQKVLELRPDDVYAQGRLNQIAAYRRQVSEVSGVLESVE